MVLPVMFGRGWTDWESDTLRRTKRLHKTTIRAAGIDFWPVFLIFGIPGVWTCLGRHDTTRVSVVRMYDLCILWAVFALRYEL